MKKLQFTFALFFMLLLGSLNVWAVDIDLNVGQIEAECGETVVVPITISESTGVCGALLTISYDENLELTGISAGDAWNKLIMTKAGDLAADAVNIFWDGMYNDDSNGIVAYLSFTAPNNSGVYPIEVTYNSGNIVDEEFNAIQLNVQNGFVSVGAGVHEHIYDANGMCDICGYTPIRIEVVDDSIVASLSKADDFTACGLVFAKDDAVSLETPGRTRIVFTEALQNGGFVFDAKGINDVTFRGFVTYEDDFGNEVIVYSNVIR